MSIFWAAVGDFIPKALGMGAVALAVVVGAALYTRWDNRRLNERNTRRMFAGNRYPASTSTEGEVG